ncbi:acyltransferase-domain-containing protein [Hygrophoropsis aurantiaca]|uniref:Acyltransferase-domain-containing protein n=1 Tax=Hygrophoropsis aurantiaca TaxID=72124 RepID=A0ACB8ATF9_9AGAM|nr:acyltransferase-domain-containing protein [Hygrophoropsis aurantiaca]
MPEGSPTPWSYLLIRLLFKFVLKIFYGTIVVENTEYIPKTGQPCIVCANHSNSLTDALLLVTSIPSSARNMLRLTAKSTQFGHKTFTSWLIESAGTVPIKRRKDFADGNADNSDVMDKLMEALELGDAICLFPEGMSRFHPTIAPLKTGVARIVSDVLTRNRDNPDFSISILTCSVTYMHRQHFRSDVLVTFNPPTIFSPKNNPELLAPVDYNQIRSLTAQMHHQISSRTIDSPSWDFVRSAKLASRIYVPLGTRMSLGDYVRVTRTFVEAFKASEDAQNKIASADGESVGPTREDMELVQLHHGLKEYQDQLVRWGVKDDRIRRPLSRRTIFTRMLIRLTWFCCLFTISLPGLTLWTPVFATTFYAVHNFKKSGPIWDTWDEIAQYKLIYGLFSGLCVWLGAVLLTLPFAPITIILVPSLMWMTLRWLEDAVSAFRAFAALVRLLKVGKPTLKEMRERRADLHSRVMNLAVQTLGLPTNPETYFLENGGKEKGRVRSRWESGAKYFSVRRRRKRDWNETLRLYDKVDYPDEGQ